jgi:hypothetical protein
MSSAGQMRLLVITHPDIAYSPDRYDHELVTSLGDLVDLTIVEWEQMARPSALEAARVAGADLATFDVCMVYVRFRFLVAGDPWDWTGFGGLRVWMEHDAWFNYSPAHPAWHGKFPDTYRRDGFHLMFATGRDLAALLRRDGVDARWMPKGYSAANFTDLGRNRSGVCTFGTMWPSRRAMIARLQHRGIAPRDVSGSFAGLNDRLNRHAAAVVCNMPGTVPFGLPGRAVRRYVPTFVRVRPAVEPMIKTFEVAGSGCAPVIDHLDELDELGFVDGQTCLTYRTFDEAADKLLAVDDDELSTIGRAAASLARTRHTWRHRAQLVVEILNSA